MPAIVLATGNAHKVEELQRLFAQTGIDLTLYPASQYGGMPFVDEIGLTFAENATLKAEALREKVPDDLYVLADDSGLEVDALDGAPGVRSARYAGEDATDMENNAKLLAALDELPQRPRTGRFVCCLVLIEPGGLIHSFIGESSGTIASEPRGSEGFGYDPLFIPNGHTITFAELGPTVKDKLSHRFRALEALVGYLQNTV